MRAAAMRRMAGCVAVGFMVTLAHGATPLFISGDVPTSQTATLTTLQPYEAYRYGTPPSYTLALTLPGAPTLSGLFRMDKSGSWLFSVESASTLGGALAVAPNDVVRVDSLGAFSQLFCGGTVGVPATSRVDAISLQGGDTGSLLLSFDVPTTLGALTFQAGDVVRFARTGPGCGGWSLAAGNPVFASAAAGVPVTSNVVGAAPLGSGFLLAFDVPTTIGAATFVPGQIVRFDGATFSVFETLAGWPAGSVVTGLSLGGNPGTVPPTLRLDKTAAPQLDTSAIVLSWAQSCSAGASNYGIYEGTLGSWYSHTLKDCDDGGVALTESIAPASGNRYYLVVPQNAAAEGSYGQRQTGPATFLERPPGASQCIAAQVTTPCPP